MAFCPGYARGLTLHGDFAAVGLFKPRRERAFSGLELDEALLARDAEPRCGLLVIDLCSGDAPCTACVRGRGGGAVCRGRLTGHAPANGAGAEDR